MLIALDAGEAAVAEESDELLVALVAVAPASNVLLPVVGAVVAPVALVLPFGCAKEPDHCIPDSVDW